MLRPLCSRSVLSLSLLLCLAGCVAPALLVPGSSQMIWALMKPLVGFDPNTVNLWEQPVIKQRMTSFLGERYAPVMQLVRTANELQQEGPLFYVVSRYTPVPEIADKAGLVWNKDTNQFAALLHKDGVTEILSEKLQAAVENQATAAVQQALPKWPAELAPLAALAVPPASEALRKPAPTSMQENWTPAPTPHRAPITGPTVQ